MNKTILTVLLTMMAITALAAPTVLRKSGECKVQVAKMFDETKVFTATLSNEDISAMCKFRADDNFFGNYVVVANPSLENKSGKALYVSYNVVMLDKAGEIVGCASQGGDLKPEAKDLQFGSCLMPIPPEQSAKIASYKIVIYVSEAKKKE